eukprot:3319322-Pleurochrysis_carterae.AAC.2
MRRRRCAHSSASARASVLYGQRDSEQAARERHRVPGGGGTTACLQWLVRVEQPFDVVGLQHLVEVGRAEPARLHINRRVPVVVGLDERRRCRSALKGRHSLALFQILSNLRR